MLMKSVKRFVGYNLDGYKLPDEPKMQHFSIYLISRIDDPNWRSVFEACVPLCKKSLDFL